MRQASRAVTWRMFVLPVILLLLLLALSVRIVRAAPPPGTDLTSPLALWVQGLHRGSTGFTCCNLADCRPTQVRAAGDHMEAWIGKDKYGPMAPDEWQEIPNDVINDTVADGAAPDGRGAWVCFYGGRVHCAVLGSGG